MEQLPIGKVIQEERMRQGMSQFELCEGLCEQPTLSRLENGTQTPSRGVINSLLERLGLPLDRFYALQTPREERLQALRRELTSCNIRFEAALEEDRPPVFRQAMEVIAAMEEHLDPGDVITRQLILRSRAILGKAENTPYSGEEKQTMLLEALRLTVPRFTPEKLTEFRYSMDEIRVLNQIALNASRMGRREEALDLYARLLSYLQSSCSRLSQAAGPISLVASNYAGVLRLCGRFQEALEIGKLGRECCVQYGHYHQLGPLTHTMAECYHFLGDDETSIDYFYQAYYLYKLVDDYKGVALLRADAKAYFKPLMNFLAPLNGLLG